jgi:hypothetical protein
MEFEREDELRPEYDLHSLYVRKYGTKREKIVKKMIRLDSDVVAVFSSSESVNEALRFLIKVTKDSL